MPNKVSNFAVIFTPLSQVTDILVTKHRCDQHSTETSVFNLHRLFPEDFPPDDPSGCCSWDFETCMRTIGHRVNPALEVF